MNIYKTDYNDVYFAGDLHGKFNLIKPTIDKYGIKECNIIICGDIGIGFEKDNYYQTTFKDLNKKLKKKQVHVYMFRGNHDAPEYFDGHHFTDFTHIHIIPDYSIIQTENRNILCVGGAISIDRGYRKINTELRAKSYMKYHTCLLQDALQKIQKTYWENETCVYDKEKLNEINLYGIKIDTVCTHTSPSFTYPYTKEGISSWLAMDVNLEKDINHERGVCDKILQHLKADKHPISHWYYGHYHYHNTEVIDDVKYVLLDMCRNYLDIV